MQNKITQNWFFCSAVPYQKTLPKIRQFARQMWKQINDTIDSEENTFGALTFNSLWQMNSMLQSISSVYTSQIPKCSMNKRVEREPLGRFIIDALTPFWSFHWSNSLNRHTATWSLFVLYNKEVEKLTVTSCIYASVLQ